MSEFKYGPFSFETSEKLFIHGHQSVRWHMNYGGDQLAEKVLPTGEPKTAIVEAFSSYRSSFIGQHQPQIARVNKRDASIARLVTSTETTGGIGRVIDSFTVRAPIPGLSSGLIDDRYPTWIIVDGQINAPMSEAEFDRLKAAHAEIPDDTEIKERQLRLGWIVGLLPGEIFSIEPESWRAPTSWELRHLVGEGSFSGKSGAEIAQLVGMSATNFRKYTASDDAKNRQAISFAAWHLLLHRLDVQRLPGHSA
ncbi:hypothetical protein [Alcaligenes aquatilis]|uniref:Uncharacterized protein n=1 Tax=Alcaligenes aquatilis TaxID=323284 RepID=A0A3G2HWY7_9BURK|nr:hypothetical protein [Alcaligenes aquatilis]AYN21573.1 hypothetical protein D3M96_14155 [Alcaligenes aquatilis]